MKDIISIIVPIYNVEEYLPRCLDSLCQQSYADLQIILVDDGSPDRCGVICDEYAARDNRIEVLHQANQGISVTRNNGLAAVKGKYIGFIDSDDFVALDMFEKMHAAIVENNADMAVCNTVRVDEDGSQKIGASYAEQSGCYTGSDFLNMYVATMHGNMANKLFSAELFKEIRFPVGRCFEDLFPLCMAIYQSKKVAYISEGLFFYCVRTGSITNSIYKGDLKKLNDYCLELKRMQIFLSEHRPDLLEAFNAQFVRYLVLACEQLHFYGHAKENAEFLAMVMTELTQLEDEICENPRVRNSLKLKLRTKLHHPHLYNFIVSYEKTFKGLEKKIRSAVN